MHVCVGRPNPVPDVRSSSHARKGLRLTTIASLHAAWEKASGTILKIKIWERAIASFIEAGYTEADVEICFRYAHRENAKFTSAIQGFTITPFKVFDFEYRWFDSLLSQARASERNRRPAPTPKEVVISLREKPVDLETADPRINGNGRHLRDVLKNLENQ